MRVGQKITQYELVKNGWQQVDVYDVYEIWTNGDKRILFDPVKKEIHLIYD